jgi:hypothetical protein
VALFWTQLASLLGPPGQVGPPGAQGPQGAGVPAGGSAGQTLRKRSAADYDSEWATAPAADPLFIQGSPPTQQQLAGASRYQWWDTSGGALTLYIEDGVN